MKKAIITVGLPGSGKTRFCSELQKEAAKKMWAIYIEMDKYRVGISKPKSIETILSNRLRDHRKEPDLLIFDGLFLTNNDVIKAITDISENMISKDITYEIHCWNPDRESCLYNDQGRRSINSRETIMRVTIEDIDVERIKSETGINNIEIIKHTVVRKPQWQCVCEKSDIEFKGNMLYSKKWAISGEEWNYTGERWSIEPEEHLEFEELDTILEELCPSLTFLQYKYIRKNLTSIEEFGENDYYSYTEYQRHKCNLDELMEVLQKFGVLQDNN